MLIVRRVNCIDAASGIVTLSKWLSGAQVERELSQPVVGSIIRKNLEHISIKILNFENGTIG